MEKVRPWCGNPRNLGSRIAKNRSRVLLPISNQSTRKTVSFSTNRWAHFLAVKSPGEMAFLLTYLLYSLLNILGPGSCGLKSVIWSDLQPSSIRGLATPWTYLLHLSLSSVILIDSSTGSPVHVLTLSIQALRGLPRLRAPGIVPCIISFWRQLPCFLIV